MEAHSVSVFSCLYIHVDHSAKQYITVIKLAVVAVILFRVSNDQYSQTDTFVFKQMLIKKNQEKMVSKE